MLIILFSEHDNTVMNLLPQIVFLAYASQGLLLVKNILWKGNFVSLQLEIAIAAAAGEESMGHWIQWSSGTLEMEPDFVYMAWQLDP